MFGVLVISVLFILGCGYAARFLLCDIWISNPKQPKNTYDPEYELYKDFLHSMEKDLEKEDINLP